MNRFVLLVVSAVCSVALCAQSLEAERKIKDIRQKMASAAAVSGNEVAVLGLATAAVDLYDNYHIVDTTYIHYLTLSGHYFCRRNDISKAIDAYQKARDLLNDDEVLLENLAPDRRTDLAIGYANALRLSGQSKDALPVYRTAIKYAQTVKDPDYRFEQARVLCSYASFLGDNTHPCYNADSADYYVYKTLDELERLRARNDYDEQAKRKYRCSCACILSDIGRYAKSLEVMEQDIKHLNTNTPDLIDYHFADAYAHCKFCLDDYSETLRFSQMLMYYYQLSAVKKYFLPEQNNSILSPYFLESSPALHRLLTAAVKTKNAQMSGDIYEYILFVKHLQMATSQQLETVVRKSGDKKLIAAYKDYLTQSKLLADTASATAQELTIAQRKMYESSSLLSENGSVFAKNNIISWQDIRQRLAKNEASIEYLCFDFMQADIPQASRLYIALVITKECASPAIIPIATESDILRYHSGNCGDLYDANKAGTDLSQVIWRTVLTYLGKRDVHKIYLSAYGIFNNIAVELLPYDRWHTVSETYNVAHLSSTGLLVDNQQGRNNQNTAAIYGMLNYQGSKKHPADSIYLSYMLEPLPATKYELEGIRTVMKRNRQKVSFRKDKKGTEQSFKSLDGKSSAIIHLATHCYLNPDSCNRHISGVCLNDGLLTLPVINTMNLSAANLVVLSNCYSGCSDSLSAGELTADGVWQMQRTFKHAGVKVVVMSLWKVDADATVVFMQYLYEELFRYRHGMINPQVALRQAQNRMRYHAQYSSPVYWAAFVAVS